MKDEFIKTIGVWGQRHYTHLKKNSPTTINVMRMSGELEEYLRTLDRDAEEMFSGLVKQLAEIDGITEALKAADQMEWVRQMNNVRNRAAEIVNEELIFI